MSFLIFSNVTGTSGSPAGVSTDGVGSSDGSSSTHRPVYHSTPEEDAVRPVQHRPASGGLYCIYILVTKLPVLLHKSGVNLSCLFITYL